MQNKKGNRTDTRLLTFEFLEHNTLSSKPGVAYEVYPVQVPCKFLFTEFDRGDLTLQNAYIPNVIISPMSMKLSKNDDNVLKLVRLWYL